MNPAHLIKMANQIGAFFEAQPDQAQAAKDVATHLQRNWEPRMRKELLQHLSVAGDGALKPVVREAVKGLAADTKHPDAA
jgi:formate dehydrogenase subunit delta